MQRQKYKTAAGTASHVGSTSVGSGARIVSDRIRIQKKPEVWKSVGDRAASGIGLPIYLQRNKLGLNTAQ